MRGGIFLRTNSYLYSHLQALDQCEMTLSKLGVVRVSADDTAGAAQVICGVLM